MKFSRIYSDVQDKVSSVIFAKRIAEEEQRRKTTLLIVLISVGVAVVSFFVGILAKKFLGVDL